MDKEIQHPDCVKFHAETNVKVIKLEKHSISFFKLLRGSSDNQDSGVIGRVDMLEHYQTRMLDMLEKQEEERKANVRARWMVIFSSAVGAVATLAVAYLLASSK